MEGESEDPNVKNFTFFLFFLLKASQREIPIFGLSLKSLGSQVIPGGLHEERRGVVHHAQGGQTIA